MKNDETVMVTTSIYIRRDILERLKVGSGRHGVSVVLDKLGEMWLDGEVEIMIKLQEVMDIEKENE